MVKSATLPKRPDHLKVTVDLVGVAAMRGDHAERHGLKRALADARQAPQRTNDVHEALKIDAPWASSVNTTARRPTRR